jgi:DNA-binding cell septation regulator SpoVG
LFGKLEASTNNVKGLCSVTFGDSFVVKNLSVVESKKGDLFVSMPCFKSKTVDEEGNPIFKEGNLAIECKIIYKEPFKKELLSEDVQKFYENRGISPHVTYVGEVVNVWRKKD